MGKLRIALIASVILNLFLAGALAGGFLKLERHGRVIAAGSLRIAGAELPRGERRAFRQALREARASVAPTARAAREARVEAAELLRRPVVDTQAVDSALARARAAEFAVRGVVERRAVAYAAAMRPADRAKLADAVDNRARRSPPGAMGD